jgi:hypothetical protein
VGAVAAHLAEVAGEVPQSFMVAEAVFHQEETVLKVVVVALTAVGHPMTGKSIVFAINRRC